MFTFLAMIFAFIMVCLTAADAMGRYFLNKPISGVYEITENYLMIFAIYFALAYAYPASRRRHNWLLTTSFKYSPSYLFYFYW
jgi:TRAP-type C4-dicarboxylate transport system permease small subunit